jgi:hypothetical protein
MLELFFDYRDKIKEEILQTPGQNLVSTMQKRIEDENHEHINTADIKVLETCCKRDVSLFFRCTIDAYKTHRVTQR